MNPCQEKCSEFPLAGRRKQKNFKMAGGAEDFISQLDRRSGVGKGEATTHFIAFLFICLVSLL